MNWYHKQKLAQQDKVLYIMRGLSGSGKSTLARELGTGGVVLSTDDFWGPNYDFDRDYLDEAHSWNKGRAEEAMQRGITPVVIDNTNVEAWQAKPYAEMAHKYGYRIEVREPDTPWRFDAEELAKRNTHGVPKEVIYDMLAKWEKDVTVNDILRSQKPKKF